jgi:hypothetical protein
MLTIQEWQEMPEIVLPFKGQETGFTLTQVTCLCPDCNCELTKVRGRIYESLGVIEMNMAGTCEHCKSLVTCRSRVYPKTGRFTQEKGGRWEEYQMRPIAQIQLRHTLDFLKYALGGQCLVMGLSLFVVKPTLTLCIGWGIAVVISILIGVWYGKFRMRK